MEVAEQSALESVVLDSSSSMGMRVGAFVGDAVDSFHARGSA